MTRYFIEIDRPLCSGFGACVEVAPQLIQLDETGKARARVEEADGEVALEAASRCPMGAINVYRSEDG
jgi:ferredoxin